MEKQTHPEMGRRGIALTRRLTWEIQSRVKPTKTGGYLRIGLKSKC